MNAGLPGTGIGGLFYIASALWMPVQRALRGRSDRHGWRRVAAQAGIAAGILAAIGVTAVLLERLMIAHAAITGTGSGRAASVQVFRWLALLGTAGVLAAVLLCVEVAGLVLRRRAVRRQPAISEDRTARAHVPLADVA